MLPTIMLSNIKHCKNLYLYLTREITFLLMYVPVCGIYKIVDEPGEAF